MKKYITVLFLLPSLAFAYHRHHTNHPAPKPPVIVTPVPTTPPIIVQPQPPQSPTQPIQNGVSIRAIDTNDDITNPQWFIDAYRQGIRLYIVDGTNFGTCTGNTKIQTQFALALGAGLKIAMYTRNPNCWPQGLQAAGMYASQLQFFAIDIESASDGLPASSPATQAMVDGITAQSVRPIIYTYDQPWAQINKNTAAFSSLPLWEPNTLAINFNNWTPNVNAVKFYPFGGWTQLAGSQQEFNVMFEGALIDLDSFDSSILK